MLLLAPPSTGVFCVLCLRARGAVSYNAGCALGTSLGTSTWGVAYVYVRVHAPRSCRIPIPPRLQQSLPQATRDKLSHQQGVANPTDITLDSLTLTSLFNGPVTQVVEAATKQLKQLDTQSCDLVR